MRNSKIFLLACLVLGLQQAAFAEDSVISAINPESTSAQTSSVASDQIAFELATIEMIQDSPGRSHPGKCSRAEFAAGCFVQRGERVPGEKGRSRTCVCP